MTRHYEGFGPQDRKMVDEDLVAARMWLDQVLRRLHHPDADARKKICNVFHIGSREPIKLMQLSKSYSKLRKSLDDDFSLVRKNETSAFAAWVKTGDGSGTMYFSANYFLKPATERTETIIHERSHTVFKISHSGMKGGGALNFAEQAGDDHHFKYVQAIKNAYCYGWLATALQPNYTPEEQGEVIQVRVPHH